ncbi:MAG: GTP cyclohydrolase I FolE [Ardenticatenia bacterium]|nr:GTP cyclohydrolase I FolE [Ardenticatenia bacterium]
MNNIDVISQNGRIEMLVRDLLAELGEDPAREGLRRTPDRVARMYRELTAGYTTDPVQLVNDAIFDIEYDEMVIVKDIDFFSLCEHHLLPFYGKAHVAYVPKGRIIGLSKIPRIVEMFARRLQVQERLTVEIAEFLDELLHPLGVAVVVEAVHLCAIMRGIQKPNVKMVTSAMRGGLRRDPRTRTEFLNLIQAELT